MADKSISDLASQSLPLASGDQALVSRNGITINKTTLADVKTFVLTGLSVDSTIIADGGIQTVDLADGLITLNKLGSNSVDSSKIVDGSITGTDIATQTIVTTNIADNAITSTKIADGTIQSNDLSDGAVTLVKLASNSVDSSKIVDGSIQTGDIANSAITPAKLAQPLTLFTAQNTITGTTIDFTGIPSWARKITLVFGGVSTNGSNNLLVQLGATTIQTTGYVSASNAFNTSSFTAGASSNNGFVIYNTAGTNTVTGHMFISLLGSNQYIGTHSGLINLSASIVGSGSVTISSGAPDRIRITTVGGTDLFDAGSVNIIVEG